MKNTIRRVLLVTGMLFGATAMYYAVRPLETFLGIPIGLAQAVGLIIFSGSIVGLICFLIGPYAARSIWQVVDWIVSRLNRMPAQDILSGSVGLIIGLVIANLLGSGLSRIPLLGPYLPAASMILFGYLGVVVAWRKKEDITGVLNLPFRSKEKSDAPRAVPKVLDTSVIIDGRIADICKTGFIEGPLVIPSFVLDELRYVADSSDALKRNRGRRGLDILNKIQNELNIEVQINEKDMGNMDVDSKLIKLARHLGGRVVTNDFNLNKVCELQKVPVLNVNDLANAVKPVVLPGEEMAVFVLKEGKETGQGVGYLDDGTMIVVDGGRKHIGETLGVLVTSVLQTAAGRMIFARPKSLAERAGN